MDYSPITEASTSNTTSCAQGEVRSWDQNPMKGPALATPHGKDLATHMRSNVTPKRKKNVDMNPTPVQRPQQERAVTLVHGDGSICGPECPRCGPDQRRRDAQAELDAHRLIASLIRLLIDEVVRSDYWRYGDGQGGFLINLILAEARERGL